MQRLGLALEAFNEICRLAVRQQDLALEAIKEQTEICKLAVQQNGLALESVNELN